MMNKIVLQIVRIWNILSETTELADRLRATR